MNKEQREHYKKKKLDRYDKIFKFYIDCIVKHQSAPSYKEIGDEFQFTKQRAKLILDDMVKEGYMIRPKDNRRSPLSPNIALVFKDIEKWRPKDL